MWFLGSEIGNKRLSYLSIAIIILFVASSPPISNKFASFVESFPNGKIDWNKGYLYGIGIGYPHLNDGSKSRALKVAQAGALSAILQVASRLRVDDQYTLKDLERKGVIIQISGLIQYEPYKQQFIRKGDYPFYRVTYRAAINGVKGLTKNLLTHLRSHPSWGDLPRQEVIGDKDDQGPWLVLDARGLEKQSSVQPAVFPKVVTEDGKTLYDLGMVEEAALTKRGMARYVVSDKSYDELMSISGRRSLVTLRDLFSPQVARAEEKPKRKRRGRYIIKNVKRAQGLTRANLVISESDAKNIREEDASSRILKRCRVIVIMSGSVGGIEGRLLYHLALGR
jgi:hypothetical protein